MKLNLHNKKLYSGWAIAFSSSIFAEGADTIGGMAKTLTGQFTEIATLMIAVAYVAGIGFGISAIFKFKQHKDNPTQVPVGTPFAMLAISVLLVFLPSLYSPAGSSIFGSDAGAGGATGQGLNTMPGNTGA